MTTDYHSSPPGYAGLTTFEQQHRIDLLELGAAGQLLMLGEIEAVLPLEDAEAYRASNPLSGDGSIKFDQQKNEAREDAMLRLLLGKSFALVVLGRGHDLNDNLKRLSGSNVEYVRVELQSLTR